MKQAKTYEPKIKKLLKGIPKSAPSGSEEVGDLIEVMLLGILQANATEKQAAKALEAIRREYVDFNELRVSPAKDLIECIGPELPHVRAKTQQISRALSSVYARMSRIDLTYLAKLPKRELRRLLEEMGLDEYAAGFLMMTAFGHHAIPVDQDLAECLEMDGYVHPGSDASTIQAFLERLAPRKQVAATHAFLRSVVQQRSKALEKKRQADAEAREKAEAEQRAKEEAEARAKAEAEEKARLREEARLAKAAEKKARVKKAAAKKARAAKRAAKKAAEKVAAKKAPAKKAVAKKASAKKASAKSAKKAPKATSAKAASKKPVRKPASKKASSTKKKTARKTK
jgi:hypothetical protein